MVNIAAGAMAGKRRKGGVKNYCAVVTLDVKNTFNTADWRCIGEALSMMGAPTHMISLVISYFVNRILTYDSNKGTEFNDITVGRCAAGIGSRNVVENGILRLPVSTGVITLPSTLIR